MNQNLLNQYRTPETPGSFFLSFEGIEGSGKTTQISDLETHLKGLGKRVLVLREPGGSTFGEKLREAILESKVPLHPLAECHLFLSSRAQLLNEKILPFLLQPDSVVILDRYIDSTIAYQGFARRLGLETVLTLHQHNPLNLLPHRTYFLDIDFQTSLERQNKRGNAKDYFESEKEEFYQQLIAGYRALPELFPNRILKIDASGDPSSIKEAILKDLGAILK
ncbi:MAG: dTMP kinase [Bdellovibrionota bacterium]